MMCYLFYYLLAVFCYPFFSVFLTAEGQVCQEWKGFFFVIFIIKCWLVLETFHRILFVVSIKAPDSKD